MSIYPTDSLFELMDFVSNKTTDTIRGGGADEQSLQSVLTGSFDEGIAFRGRSEAVVSAPSVAPDMAAGDIHGDGVDLLSSVVGTSFKQKQVDGRVMSPMLDAMMQVGNVEYGAGGPMLPPPGGQQQPPGIQQQPQFRELPAPPPQPPVAATVVPGIPQLALPAPPPPPPNTDLVPYTAPVPAPAPASAPSRALLAPTSRPRGAPVHLQLTPGVKLETSRPKIKKEKKDQRGIKGRSKDDAKDRKDDGRAARRGKAKDNTVARRRAGAKSMDAEVQGNQMDVYDPLKTKVPRNYHDQKPKNRATAKSVLRTVMRDGEQPQLLRMDDPEDKDLMSVEQGRVRRVGQTKQNRTATQAKRRKHLIELQRKAKRMGKKARENLPTINRIRIPKRAKVESVDV